jgi:hypothetical protein
MHDSHLRIAKENEDFVVASMIERCPKTMMIRELVMNALEAASKAPIDRRRVEIRPFDFEGTPKLAIWNTGPGMSDSQLLRLPSSRLCQAVTCSPFSRWRRTKASSSIAMRTTRSVALRRMRGEARRNARRIAPENSFQRRQAADAGRSRLAAR